MRQTYGDLTATLSGDTLHLMFKGCLQTASARLTTPELRSDVLYVLHRQSHEALHVLLDRLELQIQ